MILIENNSPCCGGQCSLDPTFNLALEEFLHLHRQPPVDAFMLWQNEPTIVIGRNQNTVDEINRNYVEAASIHVVRRNSGGGAVYHDLGNLNFSFLVDDCESGYHFDRFTQPVICTLQQLGIRAENSGRNDIAIAGRKISGNAQYRCHRRLLHHGTILFDTNLENLAKALKYAPDRIVGRSTDNVSRAVASICSRVTNVCEHLPVQITISEFRDLLVKNVTAAYDLKPDALDSDELEAVCKLRDEKYRSRDWNYCWPECRRGHSPSFWTHTCMRKFPWGKLDVRLEVREGIIAYCVFYGDFFSSSDPQTLASRFIGLTFNRRKLETELPENDVRRIFPDLEKKQLLDMFFH